MKISLVIPMYNESAILKDTLGTVSSFFAEHFASEEYEILFVDDGSTDSSRHIVEDFALAHVRALGYEKNRGKGYAVRFGIERAKGDFIIYTDCDLALGLSPVLEAMRVLLEGGADIVIGSRNKSKNGYADYSPLRVLASKVYIRLLRTLTGLWQSDYQCGFKAFRGEAAKSVFSLCQTDGFAFDIEALLIADKRKYKISEIPVCVTGSRPSKVNVVRDSLKMIRDVQKIKKRIKNTDR